MQSTRARLMTVLANDTVRMLLVQVGLLAVGTALICRGNWDLAVQQCFYRADLTPHWLGKHHPLTQFGYRYGSWPGAIVAAAATLGAIASWWHPRLRQYRRRLLLIVLTLVIGPGLIVNVVFKDWWGRPRPRHLVEFGGQAEYRQVWERNLRKPNSSFPCGHATMGFLFVTIYLGWRRQSPAVALAALVFSLAWGLFVGFARVSQGGHFVSDVLWAWGLTWLTATVLHGFVLKPERETVPDQKNLVPISAGHYTAALAKFP